MADQQHPNHPENRGDPPWPADDAAPGNNGARQETLGSLASLSEQSLSADLVTKMELDQAVATAHQYPRNLKVVTQKIHDIALHNEAAAAACVYALPRGGKPIVGPSIGFANALSTAYGNCRSGARWVRTDKTAKVVVCEGAFFDLEANQQTIVQATRRISGRDGRVYNDDMIEITIRANLAIARRNAILNGVPRPIWYPHYEQALIVVRGTEATLPERRHKMVAMFAHYGVEPKRVFAALGVRGEGDVTLDQLTMLRGMLEALRDGAITAEEMFDPRRMTGAHFEQVDSPLGDPGSEGGQPVGAAEDQGTAAAEGDGKKAAARKSRKGSGSKAKDGKASDSAKADAQPKPQQQQQEPEPPVPAAADEKEPGTEPAKDEEAPPRDADEYVERAKVWMVDRSTPLAARRERWANERKMRELLGIVGEQFDALTALRKTWDDEEREGLR